jgi:hypothetical protein
LTSESPNISMHMSQECRLLLHFPSGVLHSFWIFIFSIVLLVLNVKLSFLVWFRPWEELWHGWEPKGACHNHLSQIILTIR